MTSAISPANIGRLHPPAQQLLSVGLINSNANAYVNIYITNTSGIASDRVRVGIQKAGATLTPAGYICYDTEILPDDFFVLPNIGLDSQDSIWVYSQNGHCSFNVNGSQLFN